MARPLHWVPSLWLSDASSSTVCKNKTITLHLVVPQGWGLAADLWCTDWIAWLGWQQHLDSPLWEAPSVCRACRSQCMAASDSVRVETRFPTWPEPGRKHCANPPRTARPLPAHVTTWIKWTMPPWLLFCPTYCQVNKQLTNNSWRVTNAWLRPSAAL